MQLAGNVGLARCGERLTRQRQQFGLAHGAVEAVAGEREGKRPRAFCAPVRIPEVVHLVLRPHGGQNDWMTLLHELGHALHFANMRRDLPFEFMLNALRLRQGSDFRTSQWLAGGEVTVFV